jgi:hypothetical protein
LKDLWVGQDQGLESRWQAKLRVGRLNAFYPQSNENTISPQAVGYITPFYNHIWPGSILHMVSYPIVTQTQTIN